MVNVCHLSTGHISPQFHVVFDDLFETVIHNGDSDVVVNSICNGLFNCNCNLYVEDKFDADDVLIYKPPPLQESDSMRLAVAKGRRTYLGNIIKMRVLCMHDFEKLMRGLVQLLLSWTVFLKG